MSAEILDVQEQAYRLDPAISQTDLGLFKVSPRKYFNVKYEGGEGFDSSGFRMGSAFDVFFLTPDEFEDQYVLQPMFDSTPSSPQQNAFVDLMVAGHDHVTAYRECGYKIDGKTDDAVKKAADKLHDELAAYIRFFKTVDGRTILTQEDHDTMVLMRQAIENHALAGDFDEAPNGTTVFNQAKIRWQQTVMACEDIDDCEDVVFDLKGMLDRLLIHPEEKEAIIYDVKTTSKTRSGFRYYIPIYGYDLQAIMYVMAVTALLIEAGHNPAEWTIRYRWMVAQTNGLNEAFCIELDPASYDELQEKLEEILVDIHWHESTGNWSDTRVALENGGFEIYSPEGNEQE